MNRRAWMALAASLLMAGAAAHYAYQRSNLRSLSPGADLLEMLPADSGAVLFVNLAQLRAAPFIRQLYAWAPEPGPDEDYARFLKETNFHYERDLDRLAIAFEKAGPDSTFFAIAEGRFDHQKISALAAPSGTVEKRKGSEIFAIAESGGEKRIYLKFLGNDRIALTDRGDPSQTLGARKTTDDAAEWRARFERVRGSPLFAVIRQDARPGTALFAQGPGSLRSGQLSSLLDRFGWITLAGKPELDRLRVVVEGESSSEDDVVRFAELLNGVLTLGETGLNDRKTRQELDPSLRAAYLEVLKSAEVSKINRGDTKSVRLAFEITPQFLESARRLSLGSPGDTRAKPAARSAAGSRKGRP